MNNTNFDKRYDPRTYEDYLKLRDVNTKHFLMFSELIDNSISSMEKKFGPGNWDNILSIDVDIKITEEEESVFDNKVRKNSQISFTDNAFGMTEDVLIEAVKLNRKTTNIKNSEFTSKMNVHGRGLKQCAYFFGTDLTVSTTSESGETFIVELKASKQDSLDVPIYINTERGEERARGTTIIIEKIYSDKAFSHSVLQNIIQALEYRYIKYLEAKKINISFKYNNVSVKILGLPDEPRYGVRQAFPSDQVDYENLEDFISQTRKELDKKIKSGKEELDNKVLEESFDLISNLLFKAKDCKDEVFEFDLKFDILGKELDMKFWMLPHHKSDKKGIRLFEGLRAINHPGYQDSETKPYMGWKSSTFETGSTENRFAGLCDLSQLNLKSKTDKSTFTISEEIKNEIDKKIRSVWRVYNQFVIKSRDFPKFSKTKEFGINDKDDFHAMFSAKFPNKKIQIDPETSEITYESSKKNIWKIEIDTDNQLRPLDIVSYDKVEDENYLRIKIYSSHLFFQKMNNFKDFNLEILMPIAVLLSTQFIEFKEENSNQNGRNTLDWANLGGNLFDKDKN